MAEAGEWLVLIAPVFRRILLICSADMRLIALLVLALMPQFASGEIARQIAHLQPDGPAGTGVRFGYSAVLDGDTAVIGSPWHAFRDGHVFLFDTESGALTGTIVEEGGGSFGSNLDAGGGLVAVSDIFWNPVGDLPSNGARGIPIYSSTTGALVEIASNEGAGEIYGASVSVEGGQVLIGAPSGGSYTAGAFDLYTLASPGSTTGTHQIFRTPDPTTNSLFGYLVDMSEQYLVALEPVGSTLRLYDRQTGARLPDLILEEAGPFNDFRRLPSIDLDGELLILGNQEGGVAQVYNLETGELAQTLTPSEGFISGNLYRGAVAIDDGLALIGGFSGDHGRVFVFDVASGEELGELLPDAPTPRFFGAAVDLQDGVALVSAFEHHIEGRPGSAFLFRLVPEPASSALVGVALLPLLYRGRRRRV